MTNIIEKYILTKKETLDFFDCNENYHISTKIEKNWQVSRVEDIFILEFLNSKSEKYVIVKKNEMPLIYKKAEYSLIIAIDCIKLAFVVKNDMEKV